MSPRILILTAGFGEGHNSAARALKSAFQEIPGVDVELADIFAMHSPRLDRVLRRGYHRVINNAPRLWSSFYAFLDRTRHASRILSLLRGPTNVLAAHIARTRPDAIVSTYPAYGWMLQSIRARGGPDIPLFTVVTDALTINSLWYRVPSREWFVADAGSAAYLVAKGVNSEQVHVSGFPVNLQFARRSTALQPPDPARSPVRRVLYMVNSGRKRALETAATLFRDTDYVVTVTAGRDVQLIGQLQELAAEVPGRAVILGWTDQIPNLLMNHHAVISKAGGATTAEAINALCPMIVNQIVPGQEEGNYELLRTHDAAALAETPVAIVRALDRLFEREATRWHEWRRNLKSLARPEAARTISLHVMESIGAPVPAPIARAQTAAVDG